MPIEVYNCGDQNAVCMAKACSRAFRSMYAPAAHFATMFSSIQTRNIQFRALLTNENYRMLLK